MIKKISFPSKEIRDKSFLELYDMPSYEDLRNENQQLKSKIGKTFQLFQLLHYKFDDNDAIHYEIEDIQKILKE